MERRFAVHARAYRPKVGALLAAVTLCATTIAGAAPKGAEAKAAFDKGVAAYTKGDYAAASAALEKSFAAEADGETLYAWAQTERKLNHCDKASELYGTLLEMDLPAENKAAIQALLDECKAILEAQKPVEPPTPDVTPVPEPRPPPPPPRETERPSRWKHPVGLGLLGLGGVGVGVGTVFLVQAKAADSDKDSAATYGEFQDLEARAMSRGRLGVIAAATGGVLIGASLVWIMTRSQPAESGTTATLFIGDDSAGVVAFGRF